MLKMGEINQNKPLLRLRTVEESYNEIVKIDPNTKITKYFIKTLVLDGTIPSVRVGKRKRLINLDLLLDMLSDPKRFEKGDAKNE